MKLTLIAVAVFVQTVIAAVGHAENAAVIPVWDTISTACTKLIVSNTGNFGKEGIGGVNLDYHAAGDCDPTANIYIYDGSVVIGYVRNGNDTVVNFSIYGTSYLDSNGFVPVGDYSPTADSGYYHVFRSGKFVTHDSLIALEIDWYAPTFQPDTCSFVLQSIQMYLNDTTKPAPTSLRIGEVVDFNIPADTGYRNHSGFDYPHSLIYQQGSEESGDGCQPNDYRYGGVCFLMANKNEIPYDNMPHGARTLDNATQVDPTGGLVGDSLFKYMSYSGYAVSDSDNVDLHMIMTFDTLASLSITDTFAFWVGVLSHWNGTLADFLDEVEQCKQWYDGIRPIPPPDCNIRGDVDHSYGIDVGDLTYLVAYLFQGGPPPILYKEADVDGSGYIDVGDLTYLVAYLFQGGPEPPPCWW